MEDKNIIKKENKKVHILSKELEARMICKCQNIHEIKEEDIKNKNNRR